MKNKNKIYSSLFSIAILFLSLSFLVNKSEASYITSSTSKTSEEVCTNCSWVLDYWLVECLGNFAKYAEGYLYVCRSYGSKSVCCDAGDSWFSWVNPRYISSCDSSIWSYSNAGSPPQSCTTESSSSTVYTCHYISAVNSWSECQDGVNVAQDVTWSTKTVSSSNDPSCVDAVPLSRTCCYPDCSCSANISVEETCSDGCYDTCQGVLPVNHAPTVDIVSPADGSIYEKYNSIPFSGTAADPDGDAITAYDWGNGGCGVNQISNQASFSSSSGQFDTGTNTVYFRAQDEKGLWSTCDSVSFGIRPACDPASPPSGYIFCPGDDEDISGGSNISAVKVESSSDCTDSRKCEYYIAPVDGKAGEANNQVFCQKPSENLCDKGTPSKIKLGPDGKSWLWVCEGLYGGSNSKGKAIKSCAYKEVSPN